MVFAIDERFWRERASETTLRSNRDMALRRLRQRDPAEIEQLSEPRRRVLDLLIGVTRDLPFETGAHVGDGRETRHA
jgi:hypothetical protein